MTTAASRLHTETRALRMLRSGWAPKDVALETGLPMRDLAELRRDFPSPADRACIEPRCGHPRGVGRPPTGWVQIKPAGEPGAWFCSWACTERLVLDQIRKARA